MEKSLRAFARFSDGSLPVKPTLSVSAARCHLSQRERQRISWIQLLLTMSCYRLSLRESWRKAPERVRMLTVSHSHSDKVSLCKEHSCKDKHNLLPHTIAYRNAISNIKIRCARRHTPPGTP